MANTKIPSELIADSSITAAKLADGTITTADIADSNVTTAKIADSNVTTAKIGDAQVTTAKITDANVTTGKIADDAVTTAKMASNSVTSDTIASGITLAGNTTFSGNILKDSGDLTLDVAGDIILDADGDNVFYKAGGSSFYSISNVSGNTYLGIEQADKDLFIRGNDSNNGGVFTALSFDMSDRGKATFYSGITAGASTAGDWGLTLNTEAGDNMKLRVQDTGSSGGAHGTLSVSDGSLIFDVAGDIILDADGQDVLFKDAGTQFGSIRKNGNNIQLMASIQDGNITFHGDDGGSAITALTLDMSEAGAATFNSSITAGSGAFGGTSSYTSDGKVHVLDKIGLGSASNLNPGLNRWSLRARAGGVEGSFDIFDARNGESRLLIDTSGNVGIGTTSPQKNLSIGSSQGEGIQFNYDTSNNYRNQILNYWNSNADTRMDFNIGRSSGATPSTIMSVGYNSNVGIGTTSPSQKLHIVDTSNPASTTGSVIIEGRRDGTANLMELRARDASASGSALPSNQGGIVRFTGFDGTDFEEMAFIGYQAEATVADGDAPSRLMFGTTSDGAGTASEKMRITSSGNVGIGTTDQIGEKLTVNGAVQVLGNNDPNYSAKFSAGYDSTHCLRITTRINDTTESEVLGVFANSGGAAPRLALNPTNGWNVGIGETTPDRQLHIKGSTTQGGRLKLENTASGFYAGTVMTANAKEFHIGVGGSTTAAGFANNLYFYDGTAGVNRMVIDTSGNVGIGETNPLVKLDVKGSPSAPATSGTAQTGSLRVSQTLGNGVLDMGFYTSSNGTAWLQSTNKTNLATNYDIALQPNGGKVGINGNTPTNALHVFGGASDSRMQFTNNATGNAYSDGLWVGIDSTQAYLLHRDNTPIAFYTNATKRMSLDASGDLSISDNSVTTGIGHFQNTGITSTTGSNAGWSITTNSGTYNDVGSLEVAGIANRHVYKWGFSGDLSSGTWYQFAKRSELVGYGPDTGSGSEDGFAMYFRIYIYTSSSGWGEYFSNRMTNLCWLHNASSNSASEQHFIIGPGLGHAPNGGQGFPNTGTSISPVEMRIHHRYGSGDAPNADQTFEIKLPSAFTGLNPTVAGRQLIIYGYIL